MSCPIMPVTGFAYSSTGWHWTLTPAFRTSSEYIIEYEIPIPSGANSVTINKGSPMVYIFSSYDPYENKGLEIAYTVQNDISGTFGYEIVDEYGNVIASGEFNTFPHSINLPSNAFAIRIYNKSAIVIRYLEWNFNVNITSPLNPSTILSVTFYRDSNVITTINLCAYICAALIVYYANTVTGSTLPLTSRLERINHLLNRRFSPKYPIQYKIEADSDWTLTIKYIDPDGNVFCSETISGGAGTTEHLTTCEIDEYVRKLEYIEYDVNTNGVVKIWMREIYYPVPKSLTPPSTS